MPDRIDPSKKIIVLGCYVGGLGVIRALGPHRCRIIAASYNDTDFAYVSRYVSESVRLPHPYHEEEAFVDYLLEHGPEWNGALIIETEDVAAIALSKNKYRLSRYYKIASADWPVLKLFVDKQETYALAASCGVPHPKTFTPASMEEFERNAEGLIYPCILKPVHSQQFVYRFNVKNFQVGDPDQLKEKLHLCLDEGHPVMVQEIIPGPDTEIYQLQAYVDKKGEIRARFFNNKVRQNPPQFGIMRVGISTERNPLTEELSERIIEASDYRGYFHIEFRKDPRDGLLKLMEVNTRMIRPSWMAVSCGVNFPWIMFNDLVLDEPIEEQEYTVGKYWIELYSDLLNTLLRRKREDFTLTDYIRPYLAKKKAFAVMSLKDVKPFLKFLHVLPTVLARKAGPSTVFRNFRRRFYGSRPDSGARDSARTFEHQPPPGP